MKDTRASEICRNWEKDNRNLFLLKEAAFWSKNARMFASGKKIIEKDRQYIESTCRHLIEKRTGDTYGAVHLLKLVTDPDVDIPIEANEPVQLRLI